MHDLTNPSPFSLSQCYNSLFIHSLFFAIESLTFPSNSFLKFGITHFPSLIIQLQLGREWKEQQLLHHFQPFSFLNNVPFVPLWLSSPISLSIVNEKSQLNTQLKRANLTFLKPSIPCIIQLPMCPSAHSTRFSTWDYSISLRTCTNVK